MLVSGYARYGTYDVSKVSTYNDSYNDTVSDMTGTAGTLQADKELEANESQQGSLFTNQAPKHSEPADFIFDCFRRRVLVHSDILLFFSRVRWDREQWNRLEHRE